MKGLAVCKILALSSYAGADSCMRVCVCEGGLSLRLILTSSPEWNADLPIRMKDIITDTPSDPLALSAPSNWKSLCAVHSRLPPGFLDWVLLAHWCCVAGITLSSRYPKSGLHCGKGQEEEWGHCMLAAVYRDEVLYVLLKEICMICQYQQGNSSTSQWFIPQLLTSFYNTEELLKVFLLKDMEIANSLSF